VFFKNPVLQPLCSFSHIATCRSSLENTRKMSFITIFNKNSPRAYIESELDMLGVHRKLVKYVVHSSKTKKTKIKIKNSSHKLPNSNQPIFGLKEF
jgi:hypothetical protein